MPHFYHRKEKYYLTTNYKVMFSTLQHQDVLKMPKARTLFLHRVYKGMFPNSGATHYLLVRNPYDRIESFYRDKFHKTNEVRQNCIRPFYRFLEISDNDTDEEIKDKLQEVSFEQFVNLLPYVYFLDGHLTPQYEVVHTEVHGVKLRLKIDQHIKIDNHKNDDLLKSKLKLNLQPSNIKNVTSHMDVRIEWTPDLVDIVNNIYKRDFMEFDYKFKRL